ncbi:MAG TPA: CDGSH iron-sulfur domain-containing protein [Longimicrobium sp.]|jgi:CDGSH-type Zn-finger protein
MSDGQPQPETQPQVTITVRENGPYRVEGPVRIIDADGTEYPVTPGKPVSLCRCGGSTRKPFCDGTHSRIGFAAAERAVRQADAEAGGSPGSTPNPPAPSS